MPKSTKKMDTAQLLQELTDTLCQWDGDSIAEVAEKVLGHKVKCLGPNPKSGDDMFQIKEEEK